MLRRSFLVLFTILVGFTSAVCAQQDGPAIPKGQLLQAPRIVRSAKVAPLNKASTSNVFEEDFTAGKGFWSTSGSWSIGIFTGGSDNCAATNLSGNYPNNANDWLISPPISLPVLTYPSSQLKLNFWEWFEIESGYDYGRVKVSTDGGNTWTELDSRSGNSNNWRQTTVSLSSYAGQSIRLGFHFTSDGGRTYLGWYIDNLQIVLEELQPLEATLVSLNHQNFPFVYMNVAVDAFGVGLPDLAQSNFEVHENNILQTDYFKVTPPETGGGVRLADIVFLMDNSGSMKGEQDAVRDNVIDFVNKLAASGIDFALGLCRYGAKASDGDPILEDNGQLARDAEYFKNDVWNRNTTDGDKEPGYYAITGSSDNFNFRPGAQKIFIIITDEKPDQGDVTLNEALVACTNKSITLFALTKSIFYDEFDPITSATNGQCFDILDPFDEILNHISSQVANTYLIRYKSSNPVLDGTLRNVEVKVSHDGNEAVCNGSYIPGSAPQIHRTQTTLALHNQPWAEGSDLTIEAEVVDDVEPAVQSAKLYYRTTGTETYSSIEMNPSSGNIYQGTIPGSAIKTPGLDYYIEATDGQSKVSDPSVDQMNNPYQIAILPNVAPVITHAPVTSLTPNTTIIITAEIIDTTNSVNWTRLYYRKTGQLTYREVEMTNPAGDNNYSAEIPADYVTNDGVDYYIRAEDNFGVGNSSGNPDQPHLIVVAQENQPPVASFIYSPENPAAGDEITFDASSSYDPDGGEIVDYLWEFIEEGISQSGKIVTHSYPNSGDYTVILTVTDDKGATKPLPMAVNITSYSSPENYAPIFVFSAGENYYPVDPFFAGNVDKIGGVDVYDIINPKKEEVGGLSPEDFRKFTGTCNVKDYLNLSPTPVSSITVYYRVVEDVYGGKDCWVYQYWFYYVFSLFQACIKTFPHYHDWEKAFIWVDKDSKAPILVAGSCHHPRTPNPYFEISTPSTTYHPYLLIEEGSHASIVDKDGDPNTEDYDNEEAWKLRGFSAPYIKVYPRNYQLEELNSEFIAKFKEEESFPKSPQLSSDNPTPNHPWKTFDSEYYLPWQLITPELGVTPVLSLGFVKNIAQESSLLPDACVWAEEKEKGLLLIASSTSDGIVEVSSVWKENAIYTLNVYKKGFKQLNMMFKSSWPFKKKSNSIASLAPANEEVFLLGANGNIYLIPEEKAFTISGTVTDENGNTLPYATVNIYGQDGNWLFTTLTDENGGYQMPLSEDLEYTVHASLGDETATVGPITGTYGETVTVTLTTTQGLDETPPVVTIISPNLGNNTTVTQSPITISGAASDTDWGVASVSINTGQENTGDTANFSFLVELEPDTNVFIVTATDNAGNTGTDSIIVYYSPLSSPVADFSATPATGCAPLEVTFSDSSIGDVLSYLWNFGDGNTSTNQNPTHTYTNSGNYTVSLAVSGAAGSDTETKTGYITVNAAPLTLEITTTGLPEAKKRIFYYQRVLAAKGVAPYSWSLYSGSLPSGLSLSSDGVISGTPEEQGTFDLILQVTDGALQMAAKVFSLEVSQTPCEEWVMACGTTTSGYLESVAMTGPTDGWAVGEEGTILHYNGSSWSAVSSPTSGRLYSVSMVSTTDGWAVGGSWESYEGSWDSYESIILHYDGTNWTTFSSPTSSWLNSVSMVSATDGWAVGSSGTILHYDGSSWSEVGSPTSEWLSSVTMLSPTDGWAVGSSGTILHYNGSSWSQVNSPTSNYLYSVAMTGPTDGWAVGDGTILHYDGTNWTTFSSPTSNQLNSVAMTNSGDGWAVGGSTILHYDGSSWSAVSSPISGGFHSITMTDSTDGWAVGGSTILHYDGSSWSAVSSPTSDWFHSITMTDSTDGWAVGEGGTILHCDGSSWSAVSSPTSEGLSSVSMLSPTDGWAVGGSWESYESIILHYDGGNWTTFSSPTSSWLSSVTMLSPTDGWAVGSSGTILHYDGTNWTTVSSPTSNQLNSVAMTNSGDGWAVGEGGTILHYNGSSWSAVSSPTSNYLYSVAMTNSGNGWAVGENGTILHYDGTNWTTFSSPTLEWLFSVTILSSTDGWIVGSGGTILHYDGTNWTTFSSPTSKAFYSVAMTESGDGWAVGEDGTILQFIGCAAAPPNANFSATPTTGCAPLTVNFSNSSTGDILSYLWDFGNGTTSVTQNPTYTYNNPGTYTVSLTVSDTWGSDVLKRTDYIVTVIETTASNLNNVIVYPNPFKPYDGKPETGKPYDGSLHSGIIFDNLTEGATIKIFNLAGELVYEESGITGKVQWDARNESGKEVASGVYIYLVTDKAGSKPATGKFVIIR